MGESKYLVFKDKGTSASGKTKIVAVNSRSSGELLGTIRWYSPWRQYTVEPEFGTIWNKGCLEDVNAHIDGLMAERQPTSPKREGD